MTVLIRPRDRNPHLNKLMTKGGPGDKYLGGGKVDMSQWFKKVDILEDQIRNNDIWFCSAPFTMVYTTTRGEYAPCSWAAEGFNPNIKDVPIRRYFEDNKNLNDLRKEMTTPGSKLELAKKWCKQCMFQEKNYGRSRRQASLKIQTNDHAIWPGIRNAVEYFKRRNKGVFQDRIFEIQVKAFGNKCNLDCYMCIPYDSTTRLKSIHSEQVKGENVFSDYAKTPIELVKGEKLKNVVDQIVELAPYIYNLKFIGGEPLVMKDFYMLLDKICKTGHADKMFVKYQTNMSVLSMEKLRLLDYIPQFMQFEFTVSLDGIGKSVEYIRRRTNWQDVVNNIKEVKKFPNVTVNINGAISFLSVLRFYELIEWIDKNKTLFKQINWSNIRNPKKLCANVLPDEIKKKLIPKYKGFPDIQQLLEESNDGLHYQDTFDYLLMNDKYYKGTKWETHLFDVFPELEPYHKKD